MSHRIGLIHPDAPATEVFSVDGPYHFPGSRRLHFYPTIHFFHVNPAKDIFIQITHVEYELKKARLIKTVFCSKVNKKFLIIAVPKTSSPGIAMNCFLSP